MGKCYTFSNILCINNVIDIDADIDILKRQWVISLCMSKLWYSICQIVHIWNIISNYFQNLFLGFPEWKELYSHLAKIRMLMFCKKTERWGETEIAWESTWPVKAHQKLPSGQNSMSIPITHSNLSNNLKTYTIYRLPVYHLIDVCFLCMVSSLIRRTFYTLTLFLCLASSLLRMPIL